MAENGSLPPMVQYALPMSREHNIHWKNGSNYNDNDNIITLPTSAMTKDQKKVTKITNDCPMDV